MWGRVCCGTAASRPWQVTECSSYWDTKPEYQQGWVMLLSEVSHLMDFPFENNAWCNFCILDIRGLHLLPVKPSVFLSVPRFTLPFQGVMLFSLSSVQAHLACHCCLKPLPSQGILVVSCLDAPLPCVTSWFRELFWLKNNYIFGAVRCQPVHCAITQVSFWSKGVGVRCRRVGAEQSWYKPG